MASSRGTSNGPGSQDVALMLEAFEAQNRVRISLRGNYCLTGGLADIRWEAQAMEDNEDSGVAQPLASVSVTCLQGSFKTLEGLITYLLYQLDFQLAESEWANVNAAE